jgi:hypothetical protein
MLLLGHTVITCLRETQYDGLESFTSVGPFVPLLTDADGQVVREVAAAWFTLTVPEQEAVELPLQVALIRDWSWRIPATPPAWDTDPEGDAAAWWDSDWVAPPAPPGPTQPKLIPIVSTDLTLDPLTLVELYTARWPCQENVIKDLLLSLGLDVSHGFAKQPTTNTETAKQRAELERRDQALQERADGARQRMQTALTRKQRYHVDQQ